MKAKIFYLFMLFFFFLNAFSQNNFIRSKTVVLNGNAKQYRGLSLCVLKPDNPLNKKSDTLAIFSPDAQGNFSVSFELLTTQRIEIPLLALNGVFYAQPGENYTLKLPERIEKEKVDEFNPFFTPADVFLAVENELEKDLTFRISNFEDSVKYMIIKPFTLKNGRMGKKQTELLISRVDSIFSDNEQDYFYHYREFRYNMIRFLSYKHNSEQLLKDYFRVKPMLNLPTYWQLFDLAADNGLAMLASQRDSNIVKLLSKGGKLDDLRKLMEKNSEFSDPTFRDLFIVKGLYDAFYHTNYPKKNLSALLQEMCTSAPDPDVLNLAKAAYQGVTELQVGTKAPVHQLVDSLGNTIDLTQFRGKYVYLSFGTSWSVAFQREMVLLNELDKLSVPDFVIVTVSLDDDFSKMIKLFKDNGYAWPLLHYNFNKNIIKEYKIRTNPIFYLIDPDGNLRFSPAPMISEGFREQFQPILDQKRREMYKKNQGIIRNKPAEKQD